MTAARISIRDGRPATAPEGSYGTTVSEGPDGTEKDRTGAEVTETDRTGAQVSGVEGTGAVGIDVKGTEGVATVDTSNNDNATTTIGRRWRAIVGRAMNELCWRFDGDDVGTTDGVNESTWRHADSG